jgi:hypothetical protein
VVVVIGFIVGTINPIQNVEGTVGTHEENVVSGEILNLAITLQDNQLWEDCDRF